MLKQLLENRIVNRHYLGFTFQQHVYELKNCEDVLGIKAKSLHIENRHIAAGYMTDESIFFRSLHFGKTIVTLTGDNHQAIVQLFVQHSGEICIEVKPNIKDANIVPVYFRTILADTAIAIDLKGALKNYLVTQYYMGEIDTIMEVHYQSMHPNVLKNSYAGHFVLGNHPDGRRITEAEEYILASRVANLKFSKIIIQQQGVTKTIIINTLLTFAMTNKIFVTSELSI
ncbi:hypothetical protein [Lysinibacillus cavernae]|uniref:hypothetical protein n=1 Tax=Lysinibacillus cavernae TaxID=2666135 RepID=UPI0012D9F98A|nr:hypothetical protein [Lysinibacillus cavernae]